MSRASVTTFGRGVSFVASGETGTQANEFEAAIKSVTSSTTVGAVFLYDTRNDSDGGAWRKKARGSWYYEDLNTATRGGRREFPSVALIVADSESAEETLTIYDLDDPSMPMWMQFLDAGALTWASGSPRTLNAITALNGRVYLGWQDGLLEFNFAEDDMRIGFSSAYQLTSGRDIASRNVTSTSHPSGDGYVLVQSFVNEVAASYLEGGELDSLGLVRPVVACATNDGVSIIHGGSGAVYDIKGNQTYREYKKVFFTDDGKVGFNYEASGTQNRAVFTGIEPIPYADKTTGGIDCAAEKFAEGNYGNHASNEFGLATTTSLNSSDDAIPSAVIPTTKTGLAFGYPDRLSIVKRNTGYDKEGAVAYVTSAYNTGYMLGDIRFAGLARSKSEDRSVKNNDLSTTGTITNAVVATDSEMVGYSGFSTSNFLTRASAALGTSMDLGTTVTVMAWVKVTEAGGYQTICSYNTASQAVGFQMLIDGNERPYFYIYGASATVSSDFGAALTVGQWHQLVGVNTGSRVQIYVDGKLGSDDAGVAGSMDNSSANFHVGVVYNETLPWLGSLSLVRVSKTAATPQQVKEMYEAEAPLFRAGAKCLLQSDGGSPNLINDLSYDNSTELLNVYQQGTNVAESRFRGLEMVETYGGKSNGWDSSTTALGSTAAGVKASVRTSGTGGVIVDLPAIDVRGDLNTADTKLPDDGKLHFSGVTTDATPTVIGNIPIAENESYLLRVNVKASRYNNATSSAKATYVIEQEVSRPLGGNVAVSTASRQLADEGDSAIDFVIESDTTAQTAKLKATGVSWARMQWSATVEVQRITERSYER